MRKRRSRRNDTGVAITDLIDRATLQAFQDRFTEKYYKVPTAILDKNANPITFEREHSKYCQAIRKSSEGFKECRKSDQSIIDRVYATGKPQWGVCSHGRLLDFAAPIRVAGEIRACFFIGQVRGKCGNLDTRQFQAAACSRHPCSAVGVPESGSPPSPDLASLFEKIRLFSDSGEVRRLEKEAIAFAKDLSCVLSKVYEWRKPREIRQFVAEMVTCADMDALLALCVRRIPNLMGTRHCSVLTVESGHSAGSERLVLRRTTFELSKRLEGFAYYTRGLGLTGWVWENKRALRLRDIADQAEIARYRGLECSHTVNDSDHHREWLGVPLIGSVGEVIGVVRVPEKTRSGGGFDFKDEVLLLSIGSAVAGQIEQLRTQGIAKRAIQVCSDCAVQLSQADDVDRVTKIILRSCSNIWGMKGKSFFFNRLDPKDNRLRIADVLGKLGRKPVRGSLVSMDDSLSGKCLGLRKSVIIHDFTREPSAAKEPPVLGGLECGMSVPVEVQGRTIGTLSVGGDSRYEFSREPDLRILERLGRLAGAALTRLQAQQDAQRAFAHNCVHVGHVLGNHLASVDARISTLNMRRLTSDVTALRETLGKMSGVVKRLKSFADAWVPARARVFELRTVFAELRRTYKDPRLAWRLRGRIPMLGTPALLGQALVELIENALRYAPDKDGEVVISAFQRGAGLKAGSRNRYVVVEVGDNGPGVPKELKEAIFEPFTKHESGHLGLGLYIVRLVIEAHGGTISECGRQGRGARFRARFPQ